MKIKIPVRNISVTIAVVFMIAFIPTTTSASNATATRTLPNSVVSGAQFDVIITPSGYGAFGQVEETLPSGFTYISCAQSFIGVQQTGNTVKFTFLGSDSFTYTAQAPAVDATTDYTIQGIVRDENKNTSPMADSVITVTAEDTPNDGQSSASSQNTIETDLFGNESSLTVRSTGETLRKLKATSLDGKLTLTIPKGTLVMDRYGNPTSELYSEVAVDPPRDDNTYIIGVAYDFGPDGTTFDPPLTLEYEYDPDDIPESIDEEDLAIAYYDDSSEEWVELTGTVDTEDNTITALVEHFTTLAIIAFEVPETATPTVINVTNLIVTPQEVTAGEPVNISVAISNAGGTAGSYPLDVIINGARESRKSVSLGPGESRQTNFTVVKTAAGTYHVSAGGLSVSFTVLPTMPSVPETPTVVETPAAPGTVAELSPEPEAPAPSSQAPLPPPVSDSSHNWLLICAIIGGVLVIGLVISVIIGRRKY
jgi:hypothetical protein